STEVGNRLVDLIDGSLPERDRVRIERIECLRAADLTGAGEVERDIHPHAPRSQRFRDACNLGQILGRNDAGVRGHLVDLAAIDADRGPESRVVTYAAQVLGTVAALPEDRIAGVATLDGAVEVVPVIENANRCVRLFASA